jgi:hypothetical protein
MDPSGGKYVEWLVRQEANGTIKPHQLDGFEDEVREAIEFHRKLSKSLELQNVVDLPKDVSKVTLYQITEKMRAHKYDIEMLELRKKGKEKGFSVLYNVPPYKIIQIGGEGIEAGDAMNAACYFGIGKWCTQHENKAKQWLAGGPLWVVFKNGRSLLQTDYSAVMDVKNKPFDFKNDLKLLNILLKMNLVAPRYEQILRGPKNAS